MSKVQNATAIPPYRSLVNPSVTYDYQTHKVIHLTPQEMKRIIDSFHTGSVQKPKAVFRMKYRSLISDVSIKASELSRKVSSLKEASPLTQCFTCDSSFKVSCDVSCHSFDQLPIEIQILVFTYVDNYASYKNSLYTCKQFHHLAKPFLLRSVTFTSTYRFAQFVTCLRLNNTFGIWVEEVDLSRLRPGNADVELITDNRPERGNALSDSDHFNAYISQVLAGWRDWKFKDNLPSFHPLSVSVSKLKTNAPFTSQNKISAKHIKLTKYFKRRRSSSNILSTNTTPVLSKTLVTHLEQISDPSSHPKTNRMLSDYASSKDLPVGYILHLINLCSNLRRLNLSNITLSSDYRVKRQFHSVYPRYDLVNNYPKEVLKIIESLSSQSHLNSSTSRFPHEDISSSSTSVFSVGSFSKPLLKYNSLIPPVDLVSPEMYYGNGGDCQLFLSDLSLKLISTMHLEVIQPKEIFTSLKKRKTTLRYLNMSSMIWLNLKIVSKFLRSLLASELNQKLIDSNECTAFQNEVSNSGRLSSRFETPLVSSSTLPDLVLDLTNSGMSKSLSWAQIIDTKEKSGRKLFHQIVTDQVLSASQEKLLREIRRRGRAGENYFI